MDLENSISKLKIHEYSISRGVRHQSRKLLHPNSVLIIGLISSCWISFTIHASNLSRLTVFEGKFVLDHKTAQIGWTWTLDVTYEFVQQT